MKEITLANVLKTIQKAFDYTCPALAGHGEQVSYIYLCMLKQKGGYSEDELFNLLSVAFLHDIGAYKTWKDDASDPEYMYGHCAYGYLYLKYFSPFDDLAEMALYHHIDYKDRDKIKSGYRDEILLLHFADSVSSVVRGNAETQLLRDETKFSKSDIEAFFSSDAKHKIIDSLNNGDFREGLYSFLAKRKLSRAEVSHLVSILAYSNDFRSEDTVTHTISVCKISTHLAMRLCMDEEDTKVLEFSALVHDIGKLYVPGDILTKPGKLTDGEMELMRRHVGHTSDILKELGYKRVAEIATNHHERLDGSGYPNGIGGDKINVYSRIIAVSDIFSALAGARVYKDALEKRKVIEILRQMSDEGKLDGKLIDISIADYDEIMESMSENANEMLKNYNSMDAEINELIRQLC